MEETKMLVSSFFASILEIFYIEMQLGESKQRAQLDLTMSLEDNLIDIISQFNNLADSWDILKRMFNVGD